MTPDDRRDLLLGAIFPPAAIARALCNWLAKRRARKTGKMTRGEGMMNTLTIGDPVEVRRISRDDGEIWVPATVVVVQSDGIGVDLADGTRLMVKPMRIRWQKRAGLPRIEGDKG